MKLIQKINEKLNAPKRKMKTKTLIYIFGWQLLMLFSALIIVVFQLGNNEIIASLIVLPFVFSFLLLLEALEGRMGEENDEADTDA